MPTLDNTKLIVQADSRTEFGFCAISWTREKTLFPEKDLKQIITRTNQVQDVEPLMVSSGQDQQTGSLLLVLGRQSAEWIIHFLNLLDSLYGAIASRLFISIVAAPHIVQRVEPLVASDSEFLAPARLPQLQRKQHEGHEQLLISGEDPATTIGGAATFVAMCLLMAPPAALLQELVPPTHSVQLSRMVIEGSPSVLWNCVGPRGSVLNILENLADFAVKAEEVCSPGKIAHAKKFAQANINRSWLSPEEKSKTIAHYGVMGWGADFVVDPHLIEEVSAEQVIQAFKNLVYPLCAVLGKPK